MEGGSETRADLRAGAGERRRPVDRNASVASGPEIVERTPPAIEIELIGGRRVRFERDADPETVRRLVALLEGGAP
jgi:hypothetical protein